MIWILLATFACYNFAYVGTEGSHRFLYVKLEYNWDQEQFTTFLAAYKICYLIALWILLPFASRILKLHDATTLIVACTTGAIGNGQNVSCLFTFDFKNVSCLFAYENVSNCLFTIEIISCLFIIQL